MFLDYSERENHWKTKSVQGVCIVFFSNSRRIFSHLLLNLLSLSKLLQGKRCFSSLFCYGESHCSYGLRHKRKRMMADILQLVGVRDVAQVAHSGNGQFGRSQLRGDGVDLSRSQFARRGHNVSNGRGS